MSVPSATAYGSAIFFNEKVCALSFRARNKSITEEYIHQMIESVDKLGPYIVLMPGFALAHASPGNFVLHTDISIATFREPIDFHSENGPVSVVMCLACTDRTSHIEQLQVIAEKLMESSSIDKIAACKNKEELFSLFRE